MERIWIAGNAGSGKTTLANLISNKLGIPVYHRDYVTWNDDFTMRSEDEQVALTKNITEANKWIFEGARFTASRIDGRLERCDTIIHLELNRLLCAYRVFIRAVRKANRFDLPAVDRQPFSLELLRYVLRDYPMKKKQREVIFNLASDREINIIILKNKSDVTSFVSNLK